MLARFLKPSQSVLVNRRRPNWPCRNGSLSSRRRTRARLSERIDRCNSIVTRFPCAAAARVSIQMEHPAAPAAVRLKPPFAHRAAFGKWGSVPSCGATEPPRSWSTLNVGFYLCRVIGLSPRRRSGIRPSLSKNPNGLRPVSAVIHAATHLALWQNWRDGVGRLHLGHPRRHRDRRRNPMPRPSMARA